MWKALIDEPLMMRRSSRPPGSTLTISGSASVRIIGEEGVIFDVVEVGPRGAAIFVLTSAMARGFACSRLVSDIFALRRRAAGLAMPAIEPEFFKFSKICSAGVKLKSASITTTSCSSGRSRSSWMMSGAVISRCSCSPWCECIQNVPPKRNGKS